MARAGGTREGPDGHDSRARLLAGLPVAERRVEAAGISTPVLEGGQGDPLVLLHGIGSFAGEWSLMIPRLIDGYRVIVPDLPGLGDSDRRDRALDGATLVAWVLELIRGTCSEAPILVGHSLGGAVAARFASDHPEHVRRIVLVDPSSLGRFRPAPGVILALLRFGARPTPASRDRFLRRVLADPERARAIWGERWEALEAYDLEQAGDKRVGAANTQLVRSLGARRIPEDRLRSIQVPVDLIWGERDPLMRFRIGQEASSKFGWPLHRIEGCGHGPQIEAPDRLQEALEVALRS
jgi:pimeloyl-ACP methyl ester carboxylesterase